MLAAVRHSQFLTLRNVGHKEQLLMSACADIVFLSSGLLVCFVCFFSEITNMMIPKKKKKKMHHPGLEKYFFAVCWRPRR